MALLVPTEIEASVVNRDYRDARENRENLARWVKRVPRDTQAIEEFLARRVQTGSKASREKTEKMDHRKARIY